MICGVFGLPGAGKTTFLTRCARRSMSGRRPLPGVAAHERVFTNFECAGAYKLDFENLGKMEYADCLILIDEIMLLCDCREWKNFSDSMKYFWSHHRHFNVDVIFCSQYWSDCDKKIRVLTDTYYLLGNLTANISVAKPIWRHMGVSNDQMYDGYQLAPPLQWVFIWRPAWYAYFDSFIRRELPPAPIEPWPGFAPKLKNGIFWRFKCLFSSSSPLIQTLLHHRAADAAAPGDAEPPERDAAAAAPDAKQAPGREGDGDAAAPDA